MNDEAVEIHAGITIGSWWVALGAPTHVGVVPEVTGSALINGIALQIAKDVCSGYFIWEENPEKAAEKILEALDERTWKLRIHKVLAENDADTVIPHLLQYSDLLTEHIKKEDEVLYPWIERQLKLIKALPCLGRRYLRPPLIIYK